VGVGRADLRDEQVEDVRPCRHAASGNNGRDDQRGCAGELVGGLKARPDVLFGGFEYCYGDADEFALDKRFETQAGKMAYFRIGGFCENEGEVKGKVILRFKIFVLFIA